MFGFLKHLRRKPVATPAQDQESYAPQDDAVVTGASLAVPQAVYAPQSKAAGLPKDGAPRNGSPQSARGLELPLQAIIQDLPLELQPRVKCPNVGDLTIAVPLEKILSQLSRGSVKISFGELRQAARQVFSAESDRDRVMVALPLGEIIARLNPALITRRRVQKQVEVPDEINSPFDARGQGLAFSIAPVKAEAAPAQPVPLASSRNSLTLAATPPAPGAAPTRAPAVAAASRAPRELITHSPAAPAPAPAQPANPVETLVVALAALAEGWPEAVRKELVQLNLVDAKVALPVEAVDQGLRQGRVAFSWKSLRSWIRPVPSLAVSAHDGALLELPLKIVAPLFLARQRQANNAKQKVAVDADIPNLFFGFPQPESDNAGAATATPTTARPADTNYYVWDDTSDTARVSASEVRRGPSPGTKFVAKYATPNEVVSRASALEGVAGALIALPDGLMVASRLSPDLNADTLAAFLPQIFGKVSQCTKELRMGELNNLNFTVGNVPWKIFRVNAIFFAALGRPGEPLPTAQLAALAMDLDHKPR